MVSGIVGSDKKLQHLSTLQKRAVVAFLTKAAPQDPIVVFCWDDANPQGLWHQHNWAPAVNAREAVLQRIRDLGGEPVPNDPMHAIRFRRAVSFVFLWTRVYILKYFMHASAYCAFVVHSSNMGMAAAGGTTFRILVQRCISNRMLLARFMMWIPLHCCMQSDVGVVKSRLAQDPIFRSVMEVTPGISASEGIAVRPGIARSTIIYKETATSYDVADANFFQFFSLA